MSNIKWHFQAIVSYIINHLVVIYMHLDQILNLHGNAIKSIVQLGSDYETPFSFITKLARNGNTTQKRKPWSSPPYSTPIYNHIYLPTIECPTLKILPPFLFLLPPYSTPLRKLVLFIPPLSCSVKYFSWRRWEPAATAAVRRWRREEGARAAKKTSFRRSRSRAGLAMGRRYGRPACGSGTG